MKKILYTSFNFWKNFENKDKYYFLAISYTIPQYYNGLRYFKLVPSKELFFKTHKEGYEPFKYFESYLKEISKLKQEDIIKEMNEITSKQVVFLGWEKYKVYGECQFVIEWLYNLDKDNALEFALENNIYEENELFYL